MVRHRILFIDDDLNDLRHCTRETELFPDIIESYFASSPKEALRILDDVSCDVTVVDLLDVLEEQRLLEEISLRQPSCMRFVFSVSSVSVKMAHQCLAKPFEASDLLNRLTALDNRTESPREAIVAKYISSVGGLLPSAPSAYRMLVEAALDPKLYVGDITSVLSEDIAMTAQILRLVNSAFFGLRGHISTVGEAVRHLGLTTIKTLVLAIESFSVFPAATFKEFGLQSLWDHSLRVGLAAQRVVTLETVDREFYDEVLTAGLLHDIGKLLLASHFPAELKRVYEVARNEGIPLLQAERQILGTDHAELGAALLGLWGLPQNLCRVVKYHHEPRFCPNPSLSLLLIHCANVFLNREDIPHYQGSIDQQCLEKSGVWNRIDAWRLVCLRSAHSSH